MVEQYDSAAVAKLRFLGEAAIAALANPEGEVAMRYRLGLELVPQDASEEMLRTLLQMAEPLLRSVGQSELARQISDALNESQN